MNERETILFVKQLLEYDIDILHMLLDYAYIFDDFVLKTQIMHAMVNAIGVKDE